MDGHPVPKPRLVLGAQGAPAQEPVPLPRTKIPAYNDKATASDIIRSIGTVSKQITEDVAMKVTNSAKSANQRLEKSIIDGSNFARGTLEKTITTSRAVRNSVTKSVIEGTKTAGMKLLRSKKIESSEDADPQRCMSMPVVDMTLFDNIQFHSPMLEQKRYKSDANGAQRSEFPNLNLNNTNFDNLSIFSSTSDSNTDSVSNFSHDSHEFDHSRLSLRLENEQLTYDTPKSSRANSIISASSLPEVPERRKTKDKSFEVMRQNSMYENWTLPMMSASNDGATDPGSTASVSLSNDSPETSKPRPSNSTIYEFDPLNSNVSATKYQGVSNELLLLESFLTGDTYGTIVATDNHEDNFEEYAETDYYNPPTPPERFDSLLPEEDNKLVGTDRNSNWYVTTDGESMPMSEELKPTDSMMRKFSRKLKLDNVLQKPAKQAAPKLEIVDRPPVNTMPVPYYSGMLNRTVAPAMVEDLFKNTQPRYCVLSDQKLMCYSDPTNGVLKEAHPLHTIHSLQIVLPLSSSTTNNTYCFEVMVSPGPPRTAPRKIAFTCASVSERRNWAQKIAEHLTSGFPPKYSAEFTRLGWCYIKEGVTGEWRGAWLMLIRRVLVYYTAKDPTIQVIDLRKTRCVVTQNADEASKSSCPNDGSPNLLLDCPQATLYLRFPHEKVLKGWRYMVKLAATNNGAYIHHQQLTKEDVPVIVEKCVSFIYAHGSLSEGIYRRAGGSLTLSELLARFRRDAWSVQLSPAQHTEHDVAGVLKRFLRDLPDTLVPKDQYKALLTAIEIDEESRRFAEYHRVMWSLPLVARNTARKLFAHLHFLQTMAHANKMSAENLASVWAPTIMPAPLQTSDSIQTAWACKEVFVVRDLIAHYESIWEPTEADKRREAAIRRVLMRVMSNAAPSAPKAAGDLRAWIYVKDRSTCYQVALSPSKTSADVCIELCEKVNMDSHLLMLEEVICNESMRRIVHIDEVLLDVVLRWGYWDEEDRKDNYLVVKENSILQEMETLRHNISLVCGELKIATESSKAFKLHMFEFQKGCLCYFKDKQGSHKIEEWYIRDVIWYVGHESRRNPQSRWAITFIPRNKQKRSKEKPWFGVTIAGAVTEDRLKWMTAMTFAEHSNVLPSPRLVIT